MVKRTITFFLFIGILLLGIKGIFFMNNKVYSKNVILLEKSSVNIKYSDNDLQTISGANPNSFDNPQIMKDGVLQEMNSTVIDTKYGDMSIQRITGGFKCINLSNENAPILYVAAVNNIYEIGGTVDLKSFLTPRITNKNGESIEGTVILPNVDTSKTNFGVKYIEAIGENGNITIAPFIYNTIEFKNNITLNSEGDIDSINLSDVLIGDDNDLKLYIANYTKGSNIITIGISRGMASIQRALPLKIQSNEEVKNNVTTNKKLSIVNSKDIQVPLLVKILLSKWSYIIIGGILVALVIIFCFIGI